MVPLEVQLPDELAESLRLLKPERNLFRNRYQGLFGRRIIEPRFTTEREDRSIISNISGSLIISVGGNTMERRVL
jgi:hypothetical protein